MKIIGIGETTLDSTYELSAFPQEDHKHAASAVTHSVGGPIPAALILLSRHHLDCTLITQIGSEAEGKTILQKLHNEQLSVRHRKQPTTKHNLYLVNAQNGTRTGVKSPITHAPLLLSSAEKKLVSAADAVLFDRHEPIAAQQMLKAVTSATITLMDPSTDSSDTTLSLLWQTTLPIAPIELLKKHAPQLSLEHALAQWYELSQKPIVLTAGGRGCVLFDGRMHHVPSVKMSAIDTLGAGDIFRGAVCYGLLQGWQLPQVLQYANLVAAIQCSRPGNGTAIPQPTDITNWQNAVQYHQQNITGITQYYQQLAV